MSHTHTPSAAAPAARSVRSWPVIPASFFAMTLGLAETGNAWRLAAPLWSLPHWVGEALEAGALLSFLVWMTLFLHKWRAHRAAAVAEWRDPVQGSFLALIPESVILLALAAQPHQREIAVVLFWIGSAANLLAGAYRLGGYWRDPREAEHQQPPLFLTTTASVLVNALAAGLLGYTAYGWALVGVGGISWLVLDSVITQQLLTGQLPARTRNFMGIYMAPPVVALVAVQVLSEGSAPMPLVAALAGYAVFVSVALLMVWRWLREQPFAPGYWAYTFGVATLAQGLLLMAGRWPTPTVTALAAVAFVGSLALTGAVAVASIRLLAAGRYFPAAPAAASSASLPSAPASPATPVTAAVPAAQMATGGAVL